MNAERFVKQMLLLLAILKLKTLKTLLPLLIVCLFCIGCTNTNHKRALSLERELATAPLVSATFDSLLQQTRTLTAPQRVKLLLSSALRNEEHPTVGAKQESLLLEALPLATKRERKQLLLRLVEVYRQPDYIYISNTERKAIKYCEELEQNYTLSKEERWKVMEIKAYALNGIGSPNLYMPIWFQLLEEHRREGNPAMITKDLHMVATYLEALGDPEKALDAYREVYELSTQNKLMEQRNQSLGSIILLTSKLGRSEEVLSYYRQMGVDSLITLIPSSYSLLATCYLQLNKPDSARFYLRKAAQAFPLQNSGKASYYKIAQTFVNEQREDSAAAYLDKAMKSSQQNATLARKQHIKVSLPFVFLEVYPAFASLLLRNGKTQQAGEAFALIEPLTKTSEPLPVGQKTQIDALTHYAAYCQATRQYEKGVELMLRCDSLRNVYDANREQRASTSIVERFKMQELLYTIDLQKAELSYSQQVLIAIGVASLILIGAIAMLIHLYRQRQRQFSVILSKDREIEQLRTETTATAPSVAAITPNSTEELFRSAEEKVTSEKLFLNKELSLELLAREMGTNRSYLSSCVNTCSGGNFNQWINNYRITYVLERIDTAPNLLQLASEAGFLSSDSFYRNFKRCTQMTTSQYLKEKGNTPG